MVRCAPAMEVRGTIRIGTTEVPYEVVRSSRARRVRLRMGPRPVLEIIAPSHALLGDLNELLLPHHVWILRQLARPVELPAPLVVLTDGTRLPYRGDELRLLVSDGPPDQCSVRRWDYHLCAQVPAGDAALLAAGLEWWYRQQANRVFHERSHLWAGKLGVRFKRLTVKDQRTRWGSCSSLGNLNFNWRLLLAPRETLDYVVIHELAHLIEPNHSPAFWKYVERWCPEYNAHRAWLEKNGEWLASYFR